MTRSPYINAKSTGREYAKFFGVVLFIALTATLMSTLISFRWTDWLRWFMGGSFLVFGAFKLIGLETVVAVLPRYDLIAARYKSYAYLYPLLQVFLGGCYVLDFGPVVRDMVAVAVLTAGLIGVFQGLLRRGPTFHAVCLGRAIKLPLSTGLLFENCILLIMVVLMILARIAGI